MGESDESSTSKIIESSGCPDIQEAVEMGKKYGITVGEIDPETQEEVVKVMAAAQAVGGQAGVPLEKK